MIGSGHLIVFEGPDGAGKTTLSKAVYDDLVEKGFDVLLLSFPGKEAGTLGGLVYKIHHHPEHFEIETLDPTSRQILHIAAHVETIINTILPALSADKVVILDRFWWSTWVYGIASGVSEYALQGMLSVESDAWKGIRPTALFVLLGTSSKRSDEVEQQERWDILSALYRKLASNEQSDYPVIIIENDIALENAIVTLTQQVQNYL